MKFEFTKNGKKSLLKLDKPIVKRILSKLQFWENSANPLKFAERIEGYVFCKYRVGDNRLIVQPEIKNKRLIILRVGHRSSIYKELKNV